MTQRDLKGLIARRTREEREARGWSQPMLADRMGKALGAQVYPSTIAKIELRQREVKIDEAIVLADVFGIRLADLIGHPVGGADVLPADTDARRRALVEEISSRERASAKELERAKAMDVALDAARAQLDAAIAQVKLKADDVMALESARGLFRGMHAQQELALDAAHDALAALDAGSSAPAFVDTDEAIARRAQRAE